jgi:hypothetical protein
MAWTSTDLASVEAAIVAAAVAGYADIAIGDITLRRYTLKELRDLRNDMRGSVTTSARTSYASYRND